MSHPAAVLASLSTASRWRIVLLMAIFAGLGHFNRLSIAVAGTDVFIPKLGISDKQMGMVYSAFLIVYTVLMTPGGWLIDRIGAARALGLYGLSMGALVALTGGLSPLASRPESLWLALILIRCVAGISNVPLHPAAAHVVSDLMTSRDRASANGMITAGALVGVALVFPVFGWLMDKFGWPTAFAVTGLTLVTYGAIWRLFTEPRLPGPAPAVSEETLTEWLSEQSATDAQLDSRVAQSNSSSSLPAHHSQTAGSIVRNRDLWLVTISYAAYGYFQYLFFYWIDYYLKTVLHVPDHESRHITFYILLANGAGMAIGGLTTDFLCRRLGVAAGRRSVVMTGMWLTGVFGLLALYVTGAQTVSICLALAMGTLGICEGVFWTTATDIGGRARGFAAGFMNTGGNAGGIFSPVLSPFIAESLGWSGAIVVACAITFFGGALWLTIQIPRSHDAANEP